MQSFDIDGVKGSIKVINREEVTIQGTVNATVRGGKIKYRAANPMDKRSSFSGSGLPFANYEQAFDNSPNKGQLELGLNNTFELDILMPNSYYNSLGTVLVCPSLFITFHDGQKEKTIAIKLNNPVPYRTLTYPMSSKGEHTSRQNPTFYDGIYNLPVRSQEQILRDSGYPETLNESPHHKSLPVNFWGAKPPV
jgi:hypothetical protein